MKRLLTLCLLSALACAGPTGPTEIEENGVIRIRNSSAIAVLEVNISRCEVDTWGENRIASPVGPGQSRDFELSPDCYDVRALGPPPNIVVFFDIRVERGAVHTLEIHDG